MFHQTTPLTLAETASVFGETVTFGRLLETDRRPAGTAGAARVQPRRPDRDGVPPDRDEPLRARDAHRAGAKKGELSIERIGELWAQTADRRCSATRSRSPRATARGGRTSRTSSARPATCTRTRTASCSRCRCTRATRRSGATSCRSTSTCCAPAARCRPRSSASIVGVDLADPGFWDRGLDIIERRLDETIEARDAGRI